MSNEQKSNVTCEHVFLGYPRCARCGAVDPRTGNPAGAKGEAVELLESFYDGDTQEQKETFAALKEAMPETFGASKPEIGAMSDKQFNQHIADVIADPANNCAGCGVQNLQMHKPNCHIMLRELDLLMAEKVMGWTEIHPAPAEMQEHGEDYWGRPYSGETAEACVPHFSSDIASAWTVVECLHDIFDCDWVLSNESSGYKMMLQTPIYYNGIFGWGETVPLAICRTAADWARAEER